MSTCERWAELRDSEALGEILTAADAAFTRQHLANCPNCDEEAQLYVRLARVVKTDLTLADLRLERDVLAAYAEHQQRRRRATLPAWVAGVAALAACVALFVQFQGQEPAAHPQSPVARTEAPLRQPMRVSAPDSSKCIHLPPKGTACLHRGASVLVNQSAPNRVAVALQMGVLVSAWEQQAGWRYSVSNGDWTLAAADAVFSVEVLPNSVKVNLADGALEIRHADGLIRELLAPATATLAEEFSVGSVDLEAHRRIAALLPAPASAERENTAEHENDSQRENDSQPVETVRSPGNVRELKPPAPVSAVVTPTGHLEQAQRLRSQGRHSEAAAEYGLLLKAFPSSAEAQTALLSLAGLELSHLGHPARALGLFDRYLASGGRLAQEAQHGKILALRRLNRVSEERSEILRFVKLHPQAVQTRSLTTRLNQLEDATKTPSRELP